MRLPPAIFEFWVSFPKIRSRFFSWHEVEWYIKFTDLLLKREKRKASYGPGIVLEQSKGLYSS